MEKRRIFIVLKDFHGSIGWCAQKIGVSLQTFSLWLHDRKNSPRCDAWAATQAASMIAQLIETNGKCMGKDVDGHSARESVNRIRGAAKRRKK